MTAQLNTLIRLRQYEVDRSQTQLAGALQQERALVVQFEELERQIGLHRAQLETLSKCGQLNIDAIRLRRQYLQQLAAQRDVLEADMAAAQRITQEHRERLLAADQRLQVAEKLRERALDAAQARSVRQETLECEESWRVSSRSS